MSSYISAELRRLVAERASYLCEYCLIAEQDTFFGCEVDHIISEKHGGATEAENLAYACAFCNRHKGSDIGSIDWKSKRFSRLYHPRTDRWTEHFTLIGIEIQPLTTIGRVTERLLKLNVEERLWERQTLQDLQRYPSENARSFLQ
jgi:5-methylcytosine-specific restriction endonuclease McrA